VIRFDGILEDDLEIRVLKVDLDIKEDEIVQDDLDFSDEMMRLCV
jgi:hypothetical protein